MKMYDVTEEIVFNYLKKKKSLKEFIKLISSNVNNGKIAFFPCNKLTGILVKEIEKDDKKLFSRIHAIYDGFHNAKTGLEINVRHIGELDGDSDKISLLVICSSAYSEKELTEIENNSSYKGKIIMTSLFDYTLPDQTPEDIKSDFVNVYDLLADDKSKMIYLTAWLSKALDDEKITALYESDRRIDKIDLTTFKHYKLEGIQHDGIILELLLDIYNMKHVFLKPGDVVFDIGAYKGDTALLFADAVGEKGKVYSFEPDEQNYLGLVNNIKINNLEKLITPKKMGFHDIDENVKMVTFDGGEPHSHISKENGNEDVEMTTIDVFTEREGINKLDFIKMDVEGSEENVLKGAAKTIERFKPDISLALYHKTSDLTILPLLLRKLEKKYRIYLRCKTRGAWGLNLFCTAR